MPEVSANSSSNVTHEVVAADIVRISGEIIEILNAVKPKIFPADATQQLATQVLADARHPEGIERPENRPIRLVAVVALAGSPKYVPFNSQAMVNHQVRGKARIESTALTWEDESAAAGGFGRSNGAEAEGRVKALGEGSGREDEKSRCDRNNH